MQDTIIKDLINELKTRYLCHTIILYGSRARNEAGESSDYDLAGIREDGETTRIARFDKKNQVFLDIFIYPENELEHIGEEHLIMHDGVVLLEHEGFGEKLLSKIKILIAKPIILPPYELEVRKIWYQKMLNRAKTRDIEGLYRHIWILFTLIEDYFAFRNLRYYGPKKAFQFLEKNEPKILAFYENALSHPEDLECLERLIDSVIFQLP